MKPSYINAPGQFFLRDFDACKEGFLTACAALKHFSIRQQSWSVSDAHGSRNECLKIESSQAGPEKTEAHHSLTSDAVFIGDTSAEKVLVIISGTHGVEGYCGSALQRFLLTDLAAGNLKLPAGKAIVLLHALNPWGMQQARRCDHQGIDLNRNFVDFHQPLALYDDYAKVLSCLTMTDAVQRRLALAALRREWGDTHFDQVFSGGQYQYDWAPFYGGHGPAQAQQVIDELISSWSLGLRELVVLDLHTGLGPWGYGELISDHPSRSAANHYAQKIFGASIAITADGGSFSVAKRGLLDYRWHQLMSTAGCFLTLEFGSYGTEALFDVLLEDHNYWRQNPRPQLTDPSYRQIRRAMLEHFCPVDHLWQQSVLLRGWQIFHHLLDQEQWP